MSENTKINQKLKNYNLYDNYCPVCRNKLDEPCLYCSEKGIEDPELCPRVVGICGHIVHLHCIEKWKQKCSKCPCVSDAYEWVTVEQF